MAVEIKPQANIMLPSVTIVAHADGGWALPGGGVTYDPNEAHAIAKQYERLLGLDKPYNEANHLAGRGL